jgi:hypothetical protein
MNIKNHPSFSSCRIIVNLRKHDEPTLDHNAFDTIVLLSKKELKSFTGFRK